MKRLLILDNDPDFLELAELILKKHYIVYVHSQLESIQEIIASFNPDIILIDLFYDLNDNVAMPKAIAEIIKTSSLPFILHSAHPQIEAKAKEYNAAGYIEKPSSVIEIREYLQNYFQSVEK